MTLVCDMCVHVRVRFVCFDSVDHYFKLDFATTVLSRPKPSDKDNRGVGKVFFLWSHLNLITSTESSPRETDC